MKILHSSDLHGQYKRLINDHAETDFDVWVDSGDFFDNVGRVAKTGFSIDPRAEASFQTRWLGYKSLPRRLREWLKGRPAVICSGNHDFIRLAPRLVASGCPEVYEITPQGFWLAGYRWAGFREINRMVGEWAGERSRGELMDLTDATFANPPDILVTHSPPGGILDSYGSGHAGVSSLTSALSNPGSPVKAHFFGHVHEQAGKSEKHGNTIFYNGARTALVREVG